MYNYIYTNLQECEKKQKRIKKEMFCNIELIYQEFPSELFEIPAKPQKRKKQQRNLNHGKHSFASKFRRICGE